MNRKETHVSLEAVNTHECIKKIKRYKESGITLVALVITIIILIMLASVTINFALGNNGLIQKSKLSVSKYKETQQNELENMEETAEELNINRLPPEFQEVEYIESTGTQWINTLTKADDETEIQCKFYITEFKNDWAGIFGERLGGDNNALNLWTYNSQYYAGIGNIYPYVTKDEKECEIVLDNRRIIFNNQIVEINGNVGNSISNILIFAISTGENSVYGSKSKARFYYFNIIKSNGYVRYFIPCYSTTTVIDVNNQPCPKYTVGMYDLVEGKFYTNQGSGTFGYELEDGTYVAPK